MGPGILSDGGTGAGGHSGQVDRIVVDEKTESLTNRRPFLVLLATVEALPGRLRSKTLGIYCVVGTLRLARQEKGH